LLENGLKLTRAERQIDYAYDSDSENKEAHFLRSHLGMGMGWESDSKDISDWSWRFQIQRQAWK